MIYNAKTLDGLLINDIRDHLPIFTFCNYSVDRTVKIRYIYKRSINNDSINNMMRQLNTRLVQCI